MKRRHAIVLLVWSFMMVSPPASLAADGQRLDDENDVITADILSAIERGDTLTEIENPNLGMPDAYIDKGQLLKFFALDDLMFALALRNSMNVQPELPDDYWVTYAGVLLARKGDHEWRRYMETANFHPTAKNNPYYLWLHEGLLTLNVVDQWGGGSYEGIMKTLVLDESGSWRLSGCYYFGLQYSGEKMDGDYLRFSTRLDEQMPLELSECTSLYLVNHLNKSAGVALPVTSPP